MNKTSEKTYKFTLITTGDGKTIIQWDPNQGIDNIEKDACGRASDALLRGQVVERKKWKDGSGGGEPPDPIKMAPQRQTQSA